MNEIRHTKEFSIKLAGDDSGAFEGHAAVFGNVDSYGDIIEPGAFSKTIRERGRSVPVLWQHDQRQPIGTGEVFESSNGLVIKGRILPGLTRGREALLLLREGIVKGLSIGYSVVKDAYDSDRKVRRLTELKLYEVSVVTFPANELATVTTTAPKDGSKGVDDAGLLQAVRELRGELQVVGALKELRRDLAAKARL